MTAEIVSLCNQKGGVGKSTTTFHLARAAARRGRRVLVVDLDPQGNITSSLAAEPVDEDQAGLADALSSRAPDTIADVIVPGLWEGVDLVPTTGDALAAVSDELVIAGAGRESRLREALRAVAGEYDLILIDCPPSLGQLTSNGLTAADAVLVVTEPSLWSANGLSRLLSTIDSVRRYYHPELRIAGVLINRVDLRELQHRDWVQDITTAAAELRLPVLDPVMPRRAVISEAAAASKGLDEWGGDKATHAAELYDGYLATIEGTHR